MSKKRIEIIARGVCVKDGHVLLCHTKGADNTYLPGGHIDFEENARDALEREIREEMKRVSHATRFLGAAEHSFIQKGKRHCEINVVFQLEIDDLTIKSPPDSAEDYIEFIWAPVRALHAHSLEPAPLCDALPAWLAEDAPPERWASTIPRAHSPISE